MVAIVLGAVVNLVLNIFWIPEMKAYGAALASVLAEGLIFIILLRYTVSYFDKDQFTKLVNYLISGVLMLAVILLFRYMEFSSHTMAFLLEGLIALASYFMVLLAMKDSMLLKFIKKGSKF